MFYSHEVLTSRKHGIATIWLVATLGSRSHLKKIGRKTILEVNVPKACETITTPEAPMALRLQSNLLYGVSRVYSQQCEYVLVDAQGMQTAMRQMMKAIRHAELDLEAGRALKPEQLLLQDDPAFIPEMAFDPLNFDFSNFDLATDLSSQGESVLSPHTQLSSHSSNASIPGIEIPSSGSGGGDAFAGFRFGDDDDDVGMTDVNMRDFDDMDTGSLLPDAGFSFDPQGNMYDIEMSGLHDSRPGAETNDSQHNRGDSIPSLQVRREHEEEGQPEGQFIAANEGFNLGIDPSEPVQQPASNQIASSELTQLDSEARLSCFGTSELSHIPTETSGHASVERVQQVSMARRSRPKPLAKDTVNELRNSNLLAWTSQYVFNMNEARKHKLNSKENELAKQNAKHWLWGAGLGNFGTASARFGFSTPFDRYRGQELYNLLVGNTDDVKGQKRSREEIEAGQAGDTTRRVRSCSDSIQEFGRGQELSTGAEDGGFIMGDDEPEVGRHAPTPTAGDLSQDVSSIMPWNRSAASRSRAGSLSSNRQAQMSQQTQRRVSRVISASPLLGRGSTVLPRSRAGSVSVGSGIRVLVDQGGISSSTAGGSVPANYFSLPAVGDNDTTAAIPEAEAEIVRFGDANAGENVLTATESQLIRERLDVESNNFFAFVELAISERKTEAITSGEVNEEAADSQVSQITFESLLPPDANSRIVAAQGLLHVLVLVTRGVLHATQPTHFEDITLEFPIMQAI